MHSTVAVGEWGLLSSDLPCFPECLPEFEVTNLLIGEYWQELKKNKIKTKSEQAKQTHLAGGIRPQAACWQSLI